MRKSCQNRPSTTFSSATILLRKLTIQVLSEAEKGRQKICYQPLKSVLAKRICGQQKEKNRKSGVKNIGDDQT